MVPDMNTTWCLSGNFRSIHASDTSVDHRPASAGWLLQCAHTAVLMLYSSACCKGQLVLTVVILVHSVLLLLDHIMLSKEHGSRPLLPARLCMG